MNNDDQQETSLDKSDNDSEPENDLDQDEQDAVLDDLKNRAKAMGMSYHPAIKIKALREKMAEFIEQQEKINNETAIAAANREDSKAEKDKAMRQKAREDGEALVRIRITCTDPLKRAYTAELFQASNSVIGTKRVCIPYGKIWHVPKIIYHMIKNKQYLSFRESTVNGRPTKVKVMLPAYVVEDFPPMTTEEMKELEQRQAMEAGKQAA